MLAAHIDSVNLRSHNFPTLFNSNVTGLIAISQQYTCAVYVNI